MQDTSDLPIKYIYAGIFSGNCLISFDPTMHVCKTTVLHCVPQVNEGELPQHVMPFCISFGVLAAVLPLLEALANYKHQQYKQQQQQQQQYQPLGSEQEQQQQQQQDEEGGTAIGHGQIVGSGQTSLATSSAVAGAKPHLTVTRTSSDRSSRVYIWTSWLPSSPWKLLQLLLPSGIGFAVGMYVAPRWTLPRVLGCVAEQVWKRLHSGSHRGVMMVVASGLVLGEETASILAALGKALWK